ncbi:sensor histidine kinase [Actinomadura algeriensis]|uniref:histidine kinase n=1 Tax=Actinomadura algeriensis TaxID=1679523 RepID=A0ABR9JZT0_9ACTN|nr:histidine kinase [Actinomadura algeriensis]MBE1536080.1 signal transduction histidine kinase [Actinomadura algeriensis]
MNSGKRRRGAAVMVVATGLLAGLSVWGTVSEDGTRERLVLDIAVAVVSCAASPVLLWRPVGGALGLGVLAALSPAATPAATAGALQVAQRRPFPVAVAVAAAGVAAHAAQGLWRLNAGISLGWWLVLIVIAYAALVGWGALAQARRALIASLHERARRAEAEQGRRVAEARMLERTRMAREMHDVLAHRLSLLATYAGALEYRPDAPPERLAHAAGVVRTGVHQALEELREVIGVLRDEERDFGDRPQPVLADVPRLVEESRDAGAAVTLRDDVADPGALPPAAGRAAYRVVQEGLTNARKHAAGLPVQVTLEGRPGTELRIDLRNELPPDGAPPLAPGSGTGLVGLTERVRLAGGRLDHEAARGEFRLRARIPWPA